MLQCKQEKNGHHTMHLTSSELQDYFARIGYRGMPVCDEATLRELHALHPLHIPFENLDSWRGRRVSLLPDNVFRKLVHEGRGGYCFEHNQLFQRVLTSLGFSVQGLSARVLWMLPPDVVLPRTHMVLLVHVSETAWLVDVGFGGMTMTAPVALHQPDMQQTPHEALRVIPAQNLFTLEALVQDIWQPMYRFSLDPCAPPDYEIANWYVSSHPESRFVRQLIASRPDAHGRHALLDRRYTRHLLGGDSTVSEVASPGDLRALLQDTFALDLSQLSDLDSRLAALFPENQ
jgi:N-hydroxyarylamine O-acetyltransferase